MADNENIEDVTLGQVAEAVEKAGGPEEALMDLYGEEQANEEVGEDEFMEDSTADFLDSIGQEEAPENVGIPVGVDPDADSLPDILGDNGIGGFTISQVPAYLRTYVPVVWGALITWLATLLPWIPQGLQDWLTSGEVVLAVGVVVTAIWYALWKWLEPRLPAWLTRLLMGSNKTPAYRG